jgi:hypothetical protein
LSRSPISSPPPTVVFKPYFVDLCFETDDCVFSHSFDKHSTCIGSRLLTKMGYIGGGLGKNGHGIFSPIVPEMLPPIISLGFDVVSSFPTLYLDEKREVLFIAGGVQTNFLVEKSTKSTNEMFFHHMLEVEDIFVDEIVVDISGCYTPESTPNPNPISLDYLAHNCMPYNHAHHRKNGNHVFNTLQKRCERKNYGTIPTIRTECGWIDEWSWVHLNICLNISYCCVLSIVWM